MMTSPVFDLDLFYGTVNSGLLSILHALILDQIGCKPSCKTTEYGKGLEVSALETRQAATNVLISLGDSAADLRLCFYRSHMQ